MCTRTGNRQLQQETEDFLKPHDNEFTDRVLSPALAAQRLAGNTLQEFPDEDDLRKLMEFMMKTIQESITGDKQPDVVSWRNVAEVMMSRLMVFNGRRGNEVGKLLLSEYNHRNDQSIQKNCQRNLNEEERKLLKQ